MVLTVVQSIYPSFTLETAIYGTSYNSSVLTFRPFVIPETISAKESRRFSGKPLGLISMSPNISTNRALTRSSSADSCCMRAEIIVSALPSTDTISFCSSIFGIGTLKLRRIDMLFYHIKLKCYVVVELKVRPFEPEFVGKLNFYVNAIDELLKTEAENPTIGLLICKDVDQTEVKWAFQGIQTPMGVAKYNNIAIKEIQEQLPTTEQIQTRIQQAAEEFNLKKYKQDEA